jgi:transposase
VGGKSPAVFTGGAVGGVFKEGGGLMFALNRRTKIFVCKESTDMRSSYDTLFAKAKSVLGQDPFSGHLFLFLNRRRTSVKCLYYDGTGLVLICKRMEKGVFSRINPMYKREIVLTQAEFALFFEGADLEKRFIESPSEIRKIKSILAKEELPAAA